MNKIVFDCERMKYPDTGLYHYCVNLGRALELTADSSREQLFFYTPPGAQHWSANQVNHLTQNPLHKFIMPGLKDYDIWHSSYQNTRYMPVRNHRIRVVLTVHDLNFLYDEKKSPAAASRRKRAGGWRLHRLTHGKVAGGVRD